MREQYKVVRVANIVFCLELMFDPLVELVHIDVDQELRSEVAQRQASAQSRTLRKAAHHFPQKPQQARVLDALL